MSSLTCYLRKHAEAFKGCSADFCAFAMNRKFAGQLFFLFFFFGQGVERTLMTSRDISSQPLMAVSGCGCLENVENYVPH